MADHQPSLSDDGVTAICPGCQGAVSKFMPRGPGPDSWIAKQEQWPQGIIQVKYLFVRCLGCDRGALAVIQTHPGNSAQHFELLNFFPRSISQAVIPEAVPQVLREELRESEVAANAGAYRAATATLRSALEKVFIENGYDTGSLNGNINAAADEGVIIQARKRRAHDNVRSLGNDIVHEPWHRVEPEEFEVARKYVVWILNDLYDDRETVEMQLRANNRIPQADDATIPAAEVDA